MTKKIGVVLNSSSGSKAISKKEIEEALKGSNKLIFFNIEDGIEVVNKAARSHNIHVIVAAGGDGTVNAVAQIAVALKIPLAVLPLGTFNHFAKDLGLPQDLEQAANIAVSGDSIAVDYCTVNGRIFLNNSSLGLYPAAVERRNKIKHLVGKWLAMVLSTIRTIASVDTYKLKLQLEDVEMTFRTPFVFVGNNSYEYNKLGFTNRNSLTSGKLFVYVVRSNKLTSLLLTTVRVFFGRKKTDENYMKMTEKKVSMYCDSKQLYVSVDGEIITMKSPLIYEIHPSGLTVCVP